MLLIHDYHWSSTLGINGLKWQQYCHQ